MCNNADNRCTTEAVDGISFTASITVAGGYNETLQHFGSAVFSMAFAI
jgi:hypothetical protein